MFIFEWTVPLRCNLGPRPHVFFLAEKKRWCAWEGSDEVFVCWENKMLHVCLVSMTTKSWQQPLYDWHYSVVFTICSLFKIFERRMWVHDTIRRRQKYSKYRLELELSWLTYFMINWLKKAPVTSPAPLWKVETFFNWKCLELPHRKGGVLEKRRWTLPFFLLAATCCYRRSHLVV